MKSVKIKGESPQSPREGPVTALKEGSQPAGTLLPESAAKGLETNAVTKSLEGVKGGTLNRWKKSGIQVADQQSQQDQRSPKPLTPAQLLRQRFVTAATKVATTSAMVRQERQQMLEGTIAALRERQGPPSVDSVEGNDSSDEEDEYDFNLKAFMARGDLPAEFWQVQKLVRYLKAGNQTATVIALCNIADFDLGQEFVQVAIMESGGLEVITNLLETDYYRCKVGALKVLKGVAASPVIRRQVANMGGIELVTNVLTLEETHLNLLCTETLASLAKLKRARCLIRRHGGLPKLISLLDVDLASFKDIGHTMEDSHLTLRAKIARGSAHALWALAKSEKNRTIIMNQGGYHLLARLARVPLTSIVIPAIGILQECSTNESYLKIINNEGLIVDLVKNLKSSNTELKMLCARALSTCANTPESMMLVKQQGGLECLLETMNDHAIKEEKALLAAVTGALWQISHSPACVDRMEDLGATQQLLKLLIESSASLDDLQFNPIRLEVLTNVVGVLAEAAKTQINRDIIEVENGLAPLIKLIAVNHAPLLINVSDALGHCAEDKMCLKVIQEMDGVRLLWSLLKNPSPKVQASAAWALSPCIKNAPNSGDMVRSFVGGLELICGLLKSSDDELLAAVCFAISNIARDKENLAVISDHGVIEKLSNLSVTENDALRSKLAMAIGNCCEWSGNRALFGKSGAVANLVSYLSSSDLTVHQTSTLALFQLSKDPWNCVTMHQHGIVSHLLRLIGSDDEAVQEAAADCLQNIRKLALACEKFRYQHMKS